MTINSSKEIARLARPATADRSYQGAVSMAAGQEFKIETSPDGEELLVITVPAGKVWLVAVRVDIDEADEEPE